MITPGEQYLLLLQEKEDLLTEIDEAIKWKPRDWLYPLIAAALSLGIGLLVESLQWPLVILLFCYLGTETVIDIRKYRDRHRRGQELKAKADMLQVWLQRYS